MFGEIVDGENILKEMEKIATDKKDRPVKPIKILKMEILTDPAKEAEEKEYARLRGLQEARQAAERQNKARSKGKTAVPAQKRGGSSNDGKFSSSDTNLIGKYLPAKMMQSVAEAAATESDSIPTKPAPQKKKAPSKPNFGNFSSW